MMSRSGAASCPGSSPEMETSPVQQALALLPALALGAGMGLLYDLLRPPRYHGGAVLGAVLDLLFALAAGAGAFVFALAAPSGRLGLWELAATLLGFLLYLHFLSPLVLPLLELPFRVIKSTMELFKKFEKFFEKSAKKSFQTEKNGLL